MKAGTWLTRLRGREFRIGSLLLCLYGMALIGSDPGWAMWAGAMSAGVLLVENPPPLSVSPEDLLAGAGALGVLGLYAFAALPMALGKDIRGRLLALWGRTAAQRGAWRSGGKALAAGNRCRSPVKPFTDSGYPMR